MPTNLPRRRAIALVAPEHLQTRAVLAGAYRNGHLDATLTHATTIAPDGSAIATLCGRVRVDSLADEYADDVAALPTCRACRSRDPRAMTPAERAEFDARIAAIDAARRGA